MLRSRPILTAALACACTLWSTSLPAAAASGAAVYDGSGALVGPVLPGATDPSARFELAEQSLVWIVRQIEGAPVRLLFGESGPWDTKDLEPLRFESEDCTGNPLLAATSDPDEPRRAVIFDTMVFWSAGAGQSHRVRSVGWPQRENEECAAELVSPRFCCARLTKPEAVTASPVVGTDLASLALRPPFRVDAAR